MATRGAANRGGGPATFVGSVRRWELKWEESELPSYGAVASTPGSAPRRMQLLRWVRTEERSDDGTNAAPRHPGLIPVEDASIPSWKRSSGGTAPSAAAEAPAAAAGAPPPSSAAPEGGADPAAAAAAAANGDVAGPAPAGAAEIAAPMEAEGGS